MTEQEVVALMESSKSADEWNANCDRVKQTCDGYPSFWFKAIMLSGLAKRAMARFGETDEITVV